MTPTESAIQHRNSWRAQAPKSTLLGGWRKMSLLLGLLLAALLMVAIFAAVILAPLYRWQTGFVTLVIEQYQLGTLDAVPFARQDKAAFAASLKGSLNSAIGTEPLDLVALESADAMRDQLGPQMRQLPLRYKDVLVAYVRGQTLVVASDDVGSQQSVAYPDTAGRRTLVREPSGESNGFQGKACMLAADARVRGPRPREVVPVRDIIEAIGSAKPHTTLIALDLGDVQWDPRLGVIANLVSRQLDTDLMGSQVEATTENWVIGSHDLFEASVASVPAQRTFFARAFELALAGKADEKPWGDADGIVELDEIARYVEAWTGEWVRRTSGGRSRQRPVVWRLGKGRVPIEEIPTGIAIIRLAAKPAAAKPVAAEKDKAKPAPEAAPSATPVPATPPATPPLPAAPATPVLPRTPAPPPAAMPALRGASGALLGKNLIRLVSAEAQGQAQGEGGAAPSQPQSGGGDGSQPADEKKPDEKPDEKKPAAENSNPSQQQPDASGKPGKSAAGSGDGKGMAAASQESKSPTTAPIAAPLDVWDLLDAVGSRSADGRRDDEFLDWARPAPLDYAPHIWRQLFALAASAELRVDTSGGTAVRAQTTLDSIAKGLAVLRQKANGEISSISQSPGGSLPVDHLIAAHTAAEAAGVLRNWANAPGNFRTALAVRNDAVQTIAATIDHLGRSSGGVGTPPIDPAILMIFIEQTGRLSVALERQPVAASNERRIQLDPLETAAKTVSVQNETIRGMLERLAQGMLQHGLGYRTDPSYHQCVAALRNPLLPPNLRRAVRNSLLTGGGVALSEPPVDQPAEGTVSVLIEPLGRVETTDAQPRRLDRDSLRNIASLVAGLAALADAAGLANDTGVASSESVVQTRDDVAQVRKAAASLSEGTGNRDKSLRDVVTLGGLVARMYARFAATIELEAAQFETTQLSESERSSAVLRVIDPRDTATVSQTLLVGLPGWSSPDSIGLRLVAGSESLSLESPVEARITGSEGRLPPVGSTLRFLFDPADVKLRLPGGGMIAAGRPIQVGDLPFRADGLRMEVIANRTATAGDLKGMVKLMVMCESGRRLETATSRFKLPAQRTVGLVARRTPAAIEPTLPGGWVRARESAAILDSANGTGEMLGERTAQTEAILGLSAVPGRTTSWELGLENLAEIPRVVTVELHDVSSSSRGIETSARQRAREWQATSEAFRAGTFAGTPLAVVKKLQLPVGEGVTSVVIPPAPAAPQSLPAPKGEPAGDPAAEVAPPIGPELAVVVREETPGEPPRVWVNRLLMQVEHPSARLTASATWIRQDRSISVRLDAIDEAGRAALLPPEGIRAALVPLPATRGGVQGISIRKGQSVISRGRPSDTMIATWNGSDRDGRAWLAIDVDDYPRAFVFGVDCSPSAEEERQNPQYDWRNITFLSPTAEETFVKAPVPTIPLTLAVDAPPDAVVAEPGADAVPLVTLSLREIRGGSGFRQEARLIWAANAERQVVFTREKATGAAAFAVRASVTDWIVPAPGQGYENVDVEAEARLVLPGEQQPLIVRRRFVLDARPPTIETPPVVNVVVGRPLVIPLRVVDDPRESFAQAPRSHIPGVSGVDRVEWAIDTKGNGKPEAWLPAVGLGGGMYELRVPTTTVPPGRQTPLLVRATDRVGHANEPMRVWLDTAPLVAKNSIEGQVTLKGRGEEGVAVTADGPGAPKPTRSGKDGKFKFSDLEPGDYKLQARGAVRNQSYQSEVSPVTVAAPPAPASSVTLELK